MAVPERLEHRVREPQIEDLTQPHLPQEVVDPVKLRFVDVLMDLLRELPGGREVVTERLLDDDAPRLRHAGRGQPLDDLAEQERRDLQIEDWATRVTDGSFDAVV